MYVWSFNDFPYFQLEKGFFLLFINNQKQNPYNIFGLLSYKNHSYESA